MMNGAHREAGISVLDTPEGKKIPARILVTEDFGNRFGLGNSYFLGTVYNDTNHDGFYEDGEGIGGGDHLQRRRAGTFQHDIHERQRISASGSRRNLHHHGHQRTMLGGTITLNNVKIGSQNVLRIFNQAW